MNEIKALREQRVKLIEDARKLIPEGNKLMLPEVRVKFETMMSDASVLEDKITELRNSSQFLAADDARQSVRVPRAQPGTESHVSGERTAEKRAFIDYLKTGAKNRELLREQRDLMTGNASVLIAQDFLPQLISAKKEWGALTLAVGQKRTNNGEALKVATSNDVTQMSTPIAEGTAVSESDPSLGGFISNVDEMTTGLIKVSRAELEDSYFDLDAFIRDIFGARIARGLSKSIVTGTASNNFQSIVTSATAGVTSLAPDSLSFDDFIAAYSKLEPAYLQSASWVMNSNTRGKILGLKDSIGRPLFIPSANVDTLDSILGRPVVLSQFHADLAATNVAVQFGSLTDGYTLRTAGDVSILRLDERFAEQGMVGFIGYHRNGGYATNAGTNPIINLTQHA